MGTRAVPASRRVAELLKRRRVELGLTQRDVADQLAKSGERLPVSTLARIEQGKLDPGVRRLALLIRAYDLPADSIVDLVELEAIAAEPPKERDPKKLVAGMRQMNDAGRFPEALAAMFEVQRLADESRCDPLTLQKAELSLAIIARNLGRTRFAHRLLESLLTRPPHDSILINTLCVSASVWHYLGSSEIAYSICQQAFDRMGPGEEEHYAWAFHDRAKIELEIGKPAEAIESLSHAMRHYDPSSSDYCAALNLNARCLAALGRHEEGLDSCREALELLEASPKPRQHCMTLLTIGDLRIQQEEAQKALEPLLQALALAIPSQDSNSQFLAHYYLWKSYSALGDSARGELELDNAAHFASLIEDNSSESKEVLSLRPARRRRRPSVPSAPRAESGEDTQAPPEEVGSSRTA